MTKRGHFISNNVILEEHEWDIVHVLLDNGHNVELIPLSYCKGKHTADALIDGAEWEFKSPTGKGKWVIDNNIRKGIRQSNNVVIDLRRIGVSEKQCLDQLKKQLKNRATLKKLKVIKKNGKILDLK